MLQLNQVFEGLDIMRNFTGYVTLIEEDHFLTEDALFVLNKMIESKSQ